MLVSASGVSSMDCPASLGSLPLWPGTKPSLSPNRMCSMAGQLLTPKRELPHGGICSRYCWLLQKLTQLHGCKPIETLFTTDNLGEKARTQVEILGYLFLCNVRVLTQIFEKLRGELWGESSHMRNYSLCSLLLVAMSAVEAEGSGDRYA